VNVPPRTALIAQTSGRQDAIWRAVLRSQGFDVASVARGESLAALVSPRTQLRRRADLLVVDIGELGKEALRVERFGATCRQVRPESLLLFTLGRRLEVAGTERRWARSHGAFDLWPALALTRARDASAARFAALAAALALPAWDEAAAAHAVTALATEIADGEGDIVPRLASRGVDAGEIAARMRGSAGVALAERRYRLKWYPNCFVGSEAVDWLVRGYGLSREEAVDLGQALLEAGAIHHVVKERPFLDGTFFYRFGGGDPKLESIEIDAVVAAMRGPEGLDIRGRSYLGRNYASCFIGRDAVDWMAGRYRLEREDAVALGQRLFDLGLLHHVLDEHEFIDGYFFYRFYADEAA
jgi:hypothetical protein